MGADFEVVEIDDAAGEGVGRCGVGSGVGCGCFDGLGGVPVHAAQESGEASEEDAEVEGLGEVVVGTRGEAFDYVFRAAARGEKEDGRVAAGFAQGGDDGKAVAAGEISSSAILADLAT